MEVTVDKELQDAVALIYQRGFAKGMEAGIKINTIADEEDDESNELDPDTLSPDERAFWEHGYTAGFDEAIEIYEGDEEEPEETEKGTYDEGYDDGYEEGLRVASLNMVSVENNAYNKGYEAGEQAGLEDL